MESLKPMEDIKEKSKEGKKEEKKEEKKEKDIYGEFKRFLKLLASAVLLKDVRNVGAVIKSMGKFRKGLSLADVKELCTLLPFDEAPPTTLPPEFTNKYHLSVERLRDYSVLIEIQTVLHLLHVMKLIDSGDQKEAFNYSTLLINHLRDINRRTLDWINAKSYYFYSIACENIGQLRSRRPEFFAAYRTASLRLDQISQATLLNILLRSYMNEYEPARNLIAKTTFPESISNAQFARYLYYNGRIKAVQLEYSEAQAHLSQALRKAPQSSAKGFRLQITKLKTIVELLTGDIPDRSTFSQAELRHDLVPYFLIAQSVRAGNLRLFSEVLEKYSSVFIADRNYSLIQRLRHNVIKFGLRKIFLSYSRISLADICKRLHLDSVEETEYIVAKAIRDGIIDATIDQEERFLQTKQLIDIYSTNEPQAVFNRRVTYCLGLYNDAVKALEYPKKEPKNEKIPERREKGPVEDIADLLREDFD